MSSQLIGMRIKKPHTQRIVDKSKVREIVCYQLDQIKRNGYPNFLGVINVHFFSSSENIYYLVDGQHRYSAILDLYNKYSHDLEIIVEFVKVDRKEKIEVMDEDMEAVKIIAETHYPGVLEKKGDINFWFSADKDKKLLKFDAKVKIGTITGDLIEYRSGNTETAAIIK